jgi:uncharacterized DUF497 family protein
MIWTWDPNKNRANVRNHGFDFESAQLVFMDEFAKTQPDPHTDGDRLQTIGVIGGATLFVVHTWPEFDVEAGDEIGRIISARKATPRERRLYEEGKKRQ